MSYTCSFCGTDIPDDEKICPLCGTEQKPAEISEADKDENETNELPAESAPADSDGVQAADGNAPRINDASPAEAAKAEAEEPAEPEEKTVLSEPSVPESSDHSPAPEAGETIKKHICTSCGKEYPEGIKFCSECGGRIEEKTAEQKNNIIGKTFKVKKIACSGCGKEYPDGGKFCSECGGRIEEKEIEQERFFRIEMVKKFCCVQCGKEFSSGERFCSECGGRIEEKIVQCEIPAQVVEVRKNICSGCGKEYKDSTRFCPDCGCRIEEKIVREVLEDEPVFYRVVLTSFGSNEELTKKNLNAIDIYGFEPDKFFKVIIIAEAVLREDAEKLVAKVNHAGATAVIEEFEEISNPDGYIYQCVNCCSWYDTENCPECKEKADFQKFRRSTWSHPYIYSLMHPEQRYICYDCGERFAEGEECPCCGSADNIEDGAGEYFLSLIRADHIATATYWLNKFPDLAKYKRENPLSWCQNIDFAKKLLEKGTDVNDPPIHIWAGDKQDQIKVEFAGLLIDAGANRDTLTGLLRYAHSDDNIDFAKILIDAGADVNSDVEMLGMCRSTKVLNFLLDHGANPNLCNDGDTVLHCMIRENYEDWKHIELLLKRGADPNMSAKYDVYDENEENIIGTREVSPLEYAVCEGHNTEKLVPLLVKYGADVNAKDNNGRTALMHAVQQGNIETVKYLVNQGADVNAKTNDGYTALDFAKQKSKIYNCLLESANNPDAGQTSAASTRPQEPIEYNLGKLIESQKTIKYPKKKVCDLQIKPSERSVEALSRYVENHLGFFFMDVEVADGLVFTGREGIEHPAGKRKISNGHPRNKKNRGGKILSLFFKINLDEQGNPVNYSLYLKTDAKEPTIGDKLIGMAFMPIALPLSILLYLPVILPLGIFMPCLIEKATLESMDFSNIPDSFCGKLKLKSYLIYSFTNLFLGFLGVHDFYAGKTWKGVLHLVLSLTFFGIPVSIIWAWW